MATHRIHRYLRFAVVALIVALPAPFDASADDTEIFITESDNACELNVLFVIDTSGSMDTEVQTQPPYDPNVDYGGVCSSDRIYVTTRGDEPDCAGDDDQSFRKNANFCQASLGELGSGGSYTGSFRAWDAGREQWQLLADIDGDEDDRPVECQSDEGFSGERPGDGGFAVNGSAGPWSASGGDAVGWPNRRLVLHDGNWLNWAGSMPTETRSRLRIVKDVTQSVLDNVSDLKVGLMQFNRDDGGPVIHAVEDIEAARETLKNQIEDLEAGGQTPLSETLYEAGLYFGGSLVDFGNVDPDNLSVPESRLAANRDRYLSPVTTPAAQNHILLLTDGEPADDTDADSKIAALPGFAAATGSASCAVDGVDGACLDDMAAYLKNTDPSVTTHTIGFDVNLELLQTTASRGGGQYLMADDAASLTAAITDFVQTVRQSVGVFAAPTVPVDAFRRAQNLNAVFLSLFEPASRFRWPGNLKRYETSIGGDADSISVDLVDVNGNNAIDPDTGLISDSAQSFWSAEQDGSEVTLGGAASRLPDPGARRLFTNTAGFELTSAGNAITTANLTPADVGAPGAAERDLTVRWARGEDSRDEDDDGDTNEPRLDMGDPLHVRPATVVYGGTADNPDVVIFISTNDGYLHAINGATGAELWSFIPARLLDRLYELSVDNIAAAKQYGLDGELQVLVRGNDGEPGIGGDETVILMFGMRRGGNTVFGLDVTDRNNPRQLFEIDGSTDGFEDLGQSWSVPVPARVDIEGDEHVVAFFAGGYDDSQDNTGFSTDAVGNAIYMSDVEEDNEGELLWRAGNASTTASAGAPDLDLGSGVGPSMNFSIPSGLRVLDISGNGLADRIYVGDMGGQVWRLDIINGNPVANLVTGGVLASLGGAAAAGAPAESRRFYSPPDIVPVTVDDQLVLAVNIGSGYRAHPLDTAVDDAFFSIRDKIVFDAMTAAQFDSPAFPVVINDLVDITDDPQPPLMAADNGWLLRMTNGDGEKILNESVTFNNVTLFTSFTPGAPVACAPAGGTNRLYSIRVRDGAPVTNLDAPYNDEELTVSDRFTELAQGGIAPEPQILFVEQPGDTPAGPDATGVVAVACVGTECAGGEGDGGLGSTEQTVQRSFWFQDQGP